MDEVTEEVEKPEMVCDICHDNIVEGDAFIEYHIHGGYRFVAAYKGYVKGNETESHWAIERNYQHAHVSHFLNTD